MAMPGGGEVFTGDLASRSLKAMGARAMTVDRSVIVSDEFDPSRAQDQALFAHEMYHVEHGSGTGANESRDAEEVAARSVERMVLHRSANPGGAESHEAAHTGAPAGAPNGAPGAIHESNRQAERNPSAERGYARLRMKGMSKLDIVSRLATEALRATQAGKDQREERWGDKRGFR